MTDIDENTKPADTTCRFIGKPVVRKEDERLTQAYAVMVRSPCARVDALRDDGVGNIKMPATPYNIWKTIQDAKLARNQS
jgi:hypothetical protein